MRFRRPRRPLSRSGGIAVGSYPWARVREDPSVGREVRPGVRSGRGRRVPHRPVERAQSGLPLDTKLHDGPRPTERRDRPHPYGERSRPPGEGVEPGVERARVESTGVGIGMVREGGDPNAREPGSVFDPLPQLLDLPRASVVVQRGDPLRRGRGHGAPRCEQSRGI